MRKLIDADKLETDGLYVGNAKDSCYLCTLKHFVDTAPTADIPVNVHWHQIYTKKDLPKRSGSYLVTVYDENGNKGVRTALYLSDFKDFEINDEVEAWAEAPEPCEGV